MVNLRLAGRRVKSTFTLGLLTRIMAVLLVIEFLFIVYVHSASGGWMASTQGAEFPFIWLIVWILIAAIRGCFPFKEWPPQSCAGVCDSQWSGANDTIFASEKLGNGR
jgi:hypothetical protein